MEFLELLTWESWSLTSLSGREKGCSRLHRAGSELPHGGARSRAVGSWRERGRPLRGACCWGREDEEEKDEEVEEQEREEEEETPDTGETPRYRSSQRLLHAVSG